MRSKRTGVKMVATLLVLWLFVVPGLTQGHSPANQKVLERSFTFPSPIEWKTAAAEVSLIGVEWGRYDTQEMKAKARPMLPREKPQFFPNRTYVLALKLEAKAPGAYTAVSYAGSGLVRVTDVNGDVEPPLELTPSGFVPYSGSPGVYDIHFERSSRTIFWDLFPVAADQNHFLFQAFGYSPSPSRRGSLLASFKVDRNGDELNVVNVSPGSQSACSNFTGEFAGNIGAAIQDSLRLTVKDTVISGTEVYAQTGKPLQMKGRFDIFGSFAIEERFPDGRLTGIFKGKFSQACRTMTGYFAKPNGSRLLPFEFHAIISPVN